jgi:hypothetical protein
LEPAFGLEKLWVEKWVNIFLLTAKLSTSDRVRGTARSRDPKTENAVRDVYVCSALAIMLKDYIGNRTDGFLFQTDILRDSLNPILAKLKLKQNGKAFHSFRRFRVMHLRKNRVPWDLENSGSATQTKM